MLERKEICRCRTFVDKEREFLYKYFLLEDTKNVKVHERSIAVPCYGIEIIKEEKENGLVVNENGESLECITSVKAKIIELIEYLKENEVSPIHLIDIVGEMADEWVRDFENEARSLVDSAAFL